ncbi:MAG: glycosyltransferase family 4 protein [Chloroflexi bacterium]|nr:glycosyltransferase family 4 protein [Chloroflexota bacterium]
MSSPPLRVLFLTPYFRPYLGGIERAIEQLTFQIQRSQSVEAVAVLTTKYSFPRVPQPDWADRDTTPEGIAIYRLDGFPRRSIPLYSCPLVWFSPFQIRRYLREFNPNVVHFVGDGWFWGHFWSWFWFRRRAGFIFTPSYHTLPLSRWWLRPINGFICNVMDQVVALTRQETEQVARDYWVRPSRQAVIGWGASPLNNPQQAELDTATSDSGKTASEETPVDILCVGRLGEHKGQGWLLESYRQARARFHRPARLILVGRDEGGESALREEVRQSGLEGEVLFTGELEDSELVDWYARADLFALFSRYEAFGLVYFEAMIAGVPVLTHDVGANRELLTRGAVVVPPFDRPAAVEELVRLVNDADYRRSLGQEGKGYALEEFTWSAVADKYLAVYQTATMDKSRGKNN